MRIFPAFYLCWGVTTVAMLLEHQPIIWKQAAESLFYLADYGRALIPVQQQIGFHMGISWSLAIEEQFYLLWPLGLLWAARKRRHISTVLIIAIVAIWAWRVVLMFGFNVGWGYVYNAFDTRADALLVGCLLARTLDRRGPLRLSIGLFKSRWLVLCTILLLAVFVHMDRLPESYMKLRLTAFTIEPVLSGVLLLQLVFWGSLGWGFLEHRIVKLLARLSYSIYLYHPLVMDVTARLPIPHHLHSIVADPLILAVAAMSYFLVERPILKIRDRGREKSELLDDGIHGA